MQRIERMKDHLLILKDILKECKSRKKNVPMVWTDYRKVFDRMLHRWTMKFLELIGINNNIILFSKEAMSYQKTSMCVHTEGKLKDTEDIEI